MAFASLSPYRFRPAARSGYGTGSLFSLQEQMNRLFDDMFETTTGRAGSKSAGFPAIDVTQDEHAIEICAELPGVRREDIELSIEDGVLTLCGEKRNTRKSDDGHIERSFGHFERQLALPSAIDEDRCEADFADGVLTITIPRAEQKRRGRRIALRDGSGESTRNPTATERDEDRKPPRGGNGSQADGTGEANAQAGRVSGNPDATAGSGTA